MKMPNKKFIFTSISIIFFFFIVINMMPKPIDMDLGKIGNGKLSVVFIYDLNLAVSNQQAIEMNKASEIVGESALFLIAKTGNPNIEEFKRLYNAQSADLLFFSGDGKIFNRKTAYLSAEELVETLSVKPH